MLRQVPGWLLDRNGPLALRWRYLPFAAPWLIRFLRAGTPEGVAHQAAALARLLAPMAESFAMLAEGTRAGELVRWQGSLVVYRTAQAWADSQGGWAMRRHHGIPWEDMPGDALRELDPALAPGLHRGVLLPGNGHVVDPQAFVERIAEAFVRDGGMLLRDEATGFEAQDGRLRAVMTRQRQVPARAAVLAAGAHSRRLAAALGDRVPLETERGYHLTLRDAPFLPALPTVAAEDRFVATPMAAGLRLTGTVELAGLHAPPDFRRAHRLPRIAARLYPALAEGAGGGGATAWMGHRPSMPDSLPVIGRARAISDVILAFGHGHNGLMGGPFTGRLVTELVAGRVPTIDLAAFSPARFRA
jgi:D-amino-acid dehydrogenase